MASVLPRQTQTPIFGGGTFVPGRGGRGLAGPMFPGQQKNFGVDFKIDIIPAPVILVTRFEKLGLNIRSMREPLHDAIKNVMQDSIRENFDVGGRPLWDPLSDSTVAMKRQQGARNPDAPLIRTGLLRRVASQLNIWTINGLRGEAYVSGLPGRVWYGAVHQSGANAGQGSEIPARPFLLIQEEDIPRIQRQFERWIDRKIAASGI